MNEIQQLNERVQYLEGVIANMMKTGSYTFKKEVVFYEGIKMTTGKKIAFYGATPIVRPTGVAVSAAGIHAALVSLGLITA